MCWSSLLTSRLLFPVMPGACSVLGAVSMHVMTPMPQLYSSTSSASDAPAQDMQSEKFQPFFISCDPVRDSGEMIKVGFGRLPWFLTDQSGHCPSCTCILPQEYISDFHPSFVGLTGRCLPPLLLCCFCFTILNLVFPVPSRSRTAAAPTGVFVWCCRPSSTNVHTLLLSQDILQCPR